MHSPSKVYVFRLKPHQDLKKSILHFAQEHKIKAGVILSCVGSLEQYNLRFANQAEGKKSEAYYEILSMAGTVSESYCHLHITLANENGVVCGGHLLDENLIYTTAEIAISELPALLFERAIDSTYGYPELAISQRISAAS